MKKVSNLIKPILSLVLIITLVITLVPAYSAAKPKVKLSKTKASLTVGDSITVNYHEAKDFVASWDYTLMSISLPS